MTVVVCEGGVLALAVACSRALGPVAGSLIRDAAGSYGSLLWVLAIAVEFQYLPWRLAEVASIADIDFGVLSK